MHIQEALQQQEDCVASLQQDIGEAVTHAEWQHSRIRELEAALRQGQVSGARSTPLILHADCTTPPSSDLLRFISCLAMPPHR